MSVENFIAKFSPQREALDTEQQTSVVLSNSVNALGLFLDRFTTLTESFFFYEGNVELRFDKEKHVYFRVAELGNLIEQHGVTTIIKIIDRSAALTPWAAKMMLEKLLRTIPVVVDEKGTSWLAPMTLGDFTKIAMEAKTAHREIMEEAGDIGHMAHDCLEKSIQYAIDNDPEKKVRELQFVPTDERAYACAVAAKRWMDAHNVRWIHTEKKVYSREYEYPGTMDGLAYVDSCEDPACCAAHFKDHLSLIDWKSSNALHVEYLFQTASYEHAEEEENKQDIQDRWVLRLGKNEEEAGKFEPWYMPESDFDEDFDGFLACRELFLIVNSATERMQKYKKGVREVRKAQKAEAKAVAKAAAKVERARIRAEAKLARAEEKKRIQADAKKAREEAKKVKVDIPVLQLSPEAAKVVVEAILNPPEPNEALKKLMHVDSPFPEPTLESQQVLAKDPVMSAIKAGNFEEAIEYVRKPFVIKEEE